MPKGRPRCTPGCSMYRKSRGREHLGAMVLYTKCWLGVPRSWDTHDGKKTNRQYSDDLSHGDEVVLCAASLKTRSKSASCAVHFTDCSLFFPLTSFSFCFSGLHYPLPLFPWHSTFYPFCFLFLFSSVLFLSASFVSMLILSCFSSLFLLTFLSDS